jgi:hypothetical protein
LQRASLRPFAFSSAHLFLGEKATMKPWDVRCLPLVWYSIRASTRLCCMWSTWLWTTLLLLKLLPLLLLLKLLLVPLLGVMLFWQLLPKMLGVELELTPQLMLLVLLLPMMKIMMMATMSMTTTAASSLLTPLLLLLTWVMRGGGCQEMHTGSWEQSLCPSHTATQPRRLPK